MKDLVHVPARVRFLSLEPLLGPLDELDLAGIHWVIVGGESGPGARPMREQWVQSIRLQCEAENVPFFFKQWGGVNKRATGRLLNGRSYDQMPFAAAASPKKNQSGAPSEMAPSVGRPPTWLKRDPTVPEIALPVLAT